MLSAVKKAEDANGLILHFYDWAGKDSDVRLHVPPGATSAILTNLMEKPEGSPLPISASDEITIPIHPYDIMSVRVNYPHGQM